MNTTTVAPSSSQIRSWRHFSFQEAEARIKAHRLAMRQAAMNFREEIAPDACVFAPLLERCERAVTHVENAIFYRNLAAETQRRLNQRKEAA